MKLNKKDINLIALMVIFGVLTMIAISMCIATIANYIFMCEFADCVDKMTVLAEEYMNQHGWDTTVYEYEIECSKVTDEYFFVKVYDDKEYPEAVLTVYK